MTSETAQLLSLLCALAAAALAIHLRRVQERDWHAGRMTHTEFQAHRLLSLLMIGTIVLIVIWSIAGARQP